MDVEEVILSLSPRRGGGVASAALNAAMPPLQKALVLVVFSTLTQCTSISVKALGRSVLGERWSFSKQLLEIILGMMIGVSTSVIIPSGAQVAEDLEKKVSFAIKYVATAFAAPLLIRRIWSTTQLTVNLARASEDPAALDEKSCESVAVDDLRKLLRIHRDKLLHQAEEEEKAGRPDHATALRDLVDWQLRGLSDKHKAELLEAAMRTNLLSSFVNRAT